MSLLQNSNAISTGGGYNITDSLRFRSSASAYLSRTPTTAGNRKTWTWSGWIKRGNVSSAQFIFEAGTTANETNRIYIDSSGRLNFQTIVSGIEISSLITTALYRDPSAWYHLIFAVDTTQATASNRIKIYVNGTQVTTFNTATYQNQNTDTYINSTIAHVIGRRAIDTTLPFDGYMTEVNFVDGQALDPSDFGETNADGVWSPKEYTGSYGTNGFYLPMKETTQATGFNTVTYTGNGGTQSITGVGFSPDLIWFKNRSLAVSHIWYDSVRGSNNYLISNLANAEASPPATPISFEADGFNLLQGYNGSNQSPDNYVAWCWDAGSSTVSNTDGTITSSVRANPATGFSIVTYTGTGSTATVGHGLGSTPDMIIVKRRNAVDSWFCYHSSLTTDNYMLLNGTNAVQSLSGYWGTPSSTTFGAVYGGTNTSGGTYVAYCFSEVSGFSKFGSYTGTGATGNSVTTGFRPAFVLTKKTSGTSSWQMNDNTRDPVNPTDRRLFAESSSAESGTYDRMNFTDTGFEWTTANDMNLSGQSYIYMAFADTRDFQWNFDASGNKNNWTPNNINSNASSETTYDLMSDTPSLADEDTGNFATLNPLTGDANSTFSGGNLTVASNAAGEGFIPATIDFDITTTSGYYFEVKVDSNPAYCTTGFIPVAKFPGKMWTGGTYPGLSTYNPGFEIRFSDGSILQNGGSSAYGSGASAGDTWGFAIKNGKVWARNSSGWFNSGNPVTETNPAVTGQTGQWLLGYAERAGAYGAQCTYNFGQRPFKYTPPTGYKKLNTFNLPDSSITDGSDYFNAVTYTGNGSTQSITGVGFSPDLVWVKNRNSTQDHSVYDTVRGISRRIYTNGTFAEDYNVGNGITSFDSDGWTTGNLAGVNTNTYTYASWNWRGSDSTAVSNTDGTITSTVSANTTSGFSVVTWTGNGVLATVGHGLGSAPKVIISKCRSSGTASDGWVTYHASLGNTGGLVLNLTNSFITDNGWFNSTSPTSSVFTRGTSSSVNASGQTYVAYCFAEVEGFSKIGSYTGNGSADGPFVYTGFRPAFVLLKCSSSASNWTIFDTQRNTYNITNNKLHPNLSNAEDTSVEIDIVSNGLKMRGNAAAINATGGTYIYMAFAENPFKNSLAR